MRILRRKEQKELLVSAAMVQHRMIELVPVLLDHMEVDDFREVFRSLLSNLYDLAAGMDPAVGVGYMQGALEMSKKEIDDLRKAKAKGENDEQSDIDRESGD